MKIFPAPVQVRRCLPHLTESSLVYKKPIKLTPSVIEGAFDREHEHCRERNEQITKREGPRILEREGERPRWRVPPFIGGRGASSALVPTVAALSTQAQVDAAQFRSS